jgi:Transposase DDE domain
MKDRTLSRKESGMSHRDFQTRRIRLNAECLKLALHWLLRGVDWSRIAFRQDCTWTPRWLTATSLLWAWSDELTLVERFAAARRLTRHLFSPQTKLAESYQCFTKLLRRWTETFVACWQAALRERLQHDLAGCYRVRGFALFGVDGSRCELPRTRSHEAAYSSIRKTKPRRKSRKSRRTAPSRKANSPQLWLTTLWHVGSGLPWDWRLGPADSSERAHLLEMLPQLPAEALITADAGFIGYEFMQAIHRSGRQLLIRVGGNIRLLKKLGWARESSGTVYLWPDQPARGGEPPLTLRLVQAHNGRHPVFLVTSVLSSTTLTDAQVVELYARRWGIELFYRNLKQTFQRRKLRSTSAGNARLELHWSLAALAAMTLYALVHCEPAALSPRRLSVAKLLRAFRRMMRDYLHPTERAASLCAQVALALIDDYRRRNKTSRNYPRKKQESPPGPPKILTATRAQIRIAQALLENHRKKRVTA